jgi:hypothetical protein
VGDRGPLVPILLVNGVILALGFAVLHASARWPKGSSILVGVAVGAGLIAVGYTAYVASSAGRSRTKSPASSSIAPSNC